MNVEGWFSHREGIAALNRLGRSQTPFLFILSYDKSRIFAQPLDALDDTVHYRFPDQIRPPRLKKPDCRLEKHPVSFERYQRAFTQIIEEIRAGNTYLLNLTFKTPIQTTLSLREIYDYAQADYLLYLDDSFVCVSPERFIGIEENTLTTSPMKGTIDASLPDAEARILADPKEMAEHIMIVDLMRNDLGIVGNDIRVERFRYVDRIQAGDKELLQVSSRISARLPHDWQHHIGTIIDQLTPAGSITGTPKKRTTEIIHRVEEEERGFYTGIFGRFDGERLDSAVMIRFIEQEKDALYYYSGGGITIDSDAASEYREMIDKVYLPF
jgi:para-aminobenzoate synthetase component 1